ncbi:MAG: threonine/serine exporter family protein [Eubacteriales bacterium]|nr:threonine/serine exporter family protein [Eubacteriales bacterium]
MMEMIGQMIAAGAGSCGFSLLFHIRKPSRIAICSVAGAVVWGFYLLSMHTGWGDLFANFVAAFAGTVLSEVLARLLKSPATAFIAPAVIPLIPGGSLFYSMEAFVQGDKVLGGERLMHTAAIAGVIAVGIYIASSIFRYLSPWMKRRAEQKAALRASQEN